MFSWLKWLPNITKMLHHLSKYLYVKSIAFYFGDYWSDSLWSVWKSQLLASKDRVNWYSRKYIIYIYLLLVITFLFVLQSVLEDLPEVPTEPLPEASTKEPGRNTGFRITFFFFFTYGLSPLNRSPVWGNCGKKLSHKPQNHATQVTSSSSYDIAVDSLFHNLSRQELQSQSQVQKAVVVFMSLNCLVPKYLTSKFAVWIESNYAQRDSVDKRVVPKKEYLQGIL